MNNIYTFRLTGTSPLLCNNYLAMNYPGGVPRTDDEQVEKGMWLLYKGEDGTLKFPATGIRASLVGGGTGEKMKDVLGKSSFATSIIKQTVFILDEHVPLLSKDGTPLRWDREFTPDDFDKRRVVNNGRNAGSVMRWRPVFRDWSISIDFELDPVTWPNQKIVEQVLMPLFQKAGRRIGIGDFRPQKSGWFGRYDVQIESVA